MPSDKIVIKGARQHNLKNIDLEIPRNTLTVITGLSGSGKSSLAFDTIYAEGQRRYVESLSAYARQFLGLMNKPDVDFIEGLSPAIAIEQKPPNKNPRSTVGTTTEIYDYLRLLYAKIGKPYCPKCGNPITTQTIEQIANAIFQNGFGKNVQILAPIIRGKKGLYEKLFQELKKKGYSKVRVNGFMMELESKIPLDKNKKHTIEVVVDKFSITQENRQRLLEAIKSGIKESPDNLLIAVIEKNEMLFSQKNSCPNCGISIGELEPRMFSFNSPYGACKTCHGLGIKIEFDLDLVIPDKTKNFLEGLIAPWRNTAMENYYLHLIDTILKKHGYSVYTQFNVLDENTKNEILYGSDEVIKYEYRSKNGESTYSGFTRFEGIIPNLERIYRETKSEYRREELQRYMRELPCPSCHGKRLIPEVLSVKINQKNIIELTELSIEAAYEFFNSLKLTKTEEAIAKPILKEIKARLEFLLNVGVGYLTMSRITGTLSGGEAQRIRLATQIGSNLTGVLYVLDEPSIGLHQKDNDKLITTLKALRDLGNTLIVVEHDEDTIRNADYIVDLGPGAGAAGGKVVAAGKLEEIIKEPKSLTGAYLRKELTIPKPKIRREITGWLTLHKAAENNLKNITVKFPLGVWTCITGVSGSGKSTLINEILYKALNKILHNSKEEPGKYEKIEGVEQISDVICIDQTPIGRTPRSNPATYTGVFTPIRELFASVPEARARGYDPGQFSFNVDKGRCQACQGDGVKRIEMQFLPDVYVTCEECNGKRYDAETLQIKYKGKNIHEVLSMSVDEAWQFFQNIPPIKRKLDMLRDVGLGYIALGQPATTLSGGEAQRIKLATELSKTTNNSTLYILDEPTTGLHFADVSKLIAVLHRLVDKGNSVIVIEHNLDIIKNADWIIDLGPEGGERGGEIVFQGRPEEIVKNPKSYTGLYLKSKLEE